LMAQQIIFSAFSGKQGTSWAGLRTRCNSTSSYLCSCTSPLATLART
jgi:hypothetical protein